MRILSEVKYLPKCPFCGSDPFIVRSSKKRNNKAPAKGFHKIHCVRIWTGCPAKSETGWHKLLDDAIAEWKARAGVAAA